MKPPLLISLSFALLLAACSTVAPRTGESRDNRAENAQDVPEAPRDETPQFSDIEPESRDPEISDALVSPESGGTFNGPDSPSEPQPEVLTDLAEDENPETVAEDESLVRPSHDLLTPSAQEPSDDSDEEGEIQGPNGINPAVEKTTVLSENEEPDSPGFFVEEPSEPVSALDDIPAEQTPVEPSENTAPVFINPLLTEDRLHPEANPNENTEASEPSVLLPLPDESPAIHADASLAAEDFVTPEESALLPERFLDGPGEASIILDGRGWVFRSDLSDSGSWSFVARERDGEATVFRFRFPQDGTWDFVFERQDLSSGGAVREIRRVVVGADGDMTIGPWDSPEDTGIPGASVLSPEDRLAQGALAANSSRPEDAFALWEMDALRNDEAGERARRSIIALAVETETTPVLSTWLPRYLLDNPEVDLLAAAFDLLDQELGYGELSRDLLDFLVQEDEGLRRPEWLYRIAQAYEAPGEGRRLDQARELYWSIVDWWPMSSWAFKAQERLDWLDRHYFRVR